MDNSNLRHYGIYRGVVLDNDDPGIAGSDVKKGFGRCKVFFEGIYPEEFKSAAGKLLPWAEPIFPIFGGNAYTQTQQELDKKLTPQVIKGWTNKYTGWCSIPHVGAYVWGFFQEGNINYPKFFGMSQAGNNFMSEHKNQHVFCSDNVKIVIDENALNINSSNKFDSNNKDCTSTAQNQVKEKMPTLVNIEVTNLKPEGASEDEKSFCAINLNITGNVNANIKGNVYEQIEGNKYITHKGNTFIKQEGDIEIEHYGLLVETHYGDRKFAVRKGQGSNKKGEGKNEEIIEGTEKRTILQDQNEEICGNHSSKVHKSDKRQANVEISDKAGIIKHN